MLRPLLLLSCTLLLAGCSSENRLKVEMPTSTVSMPAAAPTNAKTKPNPKAQGAAPRGKMPTIPAPPKK